MSFYYKPIDIDNFPIIVEKCLAYVKSIDKVYNRESSGDCWYNLDLAELKQACPELQLAFDKYDLKIYLAAAYVMYKSSHSVMHSDIYPLNARINIPLLNCKGTFTTFYTSNYPPIKNLDPTKGLKKAAFGNSVPPDAIVKLVDKVELTQATVLRTKALHNVEISENNPVPRITLTLGFNKDPVYLLDN